LDAIVAGISAPSLRDFTMTFIGRSLVPDVHFTRFISETEENYRTVHVIFHENVFRLSLLTHSDFNHPIPVSIYHDGRIPKWSPESILRMSGSLSSKLTAVEKLCLTFAFAKMAVEDYVLWRRFYQLFPSVKMLHTDGANFDCIAYTLLQDREEPDDVLTFFPALEEIEIGYGEFWGRQRRSKSELAGFKPFISACQRAGHPVKVCFLPEKDLSKVDPLLSFHK
jgi:hypothetical protein